MKENEQLVIDVLRKELSLPDNVTDEEISVITKGTFIRAQVELYVALHLLWSEIEQFCLEKLA